MTVPDSFDAPPGYAVVDVSHLPIEEQARLRTMSTLANYERTAEQAIPRAKDLVRRAKRAGVGRAAALRWLYGRVPSSGCAVGACADSCTDIAMTPLEAQIIERATGLPGEAFAERCGRCPLLADDGSCSAYDVRPLVCRLFGVVPEMACTTPGCRPPRRLSTVEGLALLLAVNEVGGLRTVAEVEANRGL